MDDLLFDEVGDKSWVSYYEGLVVICPWTVIATKAIAILGGVGSTTIWAEPVLSPFLALLDCAVQSR